MKTLKTLILIGTIQLLTSNVVHAYCNFEIVGMGTSPAELQSKVAEVELSDFGLEPNEVKVAAASICSDPEYKDLELVYEYIEKKLHRIQLNNYNPTASHLENLKYHYGEPTEFYEMAYGISYYYWDLSFREVFFNSETTAEGEILISSVTITSNEYASMKRKYGADND